MLVMGLPVLVIGFIYPARIAVAILAAVWAKAMLIISGARVTIEGLERVTDGKARFLLGNHQSALDIPIIVWAFRGNVRFMAKESLFRIPIFGWNLRRYGYVPVDRSSARAALRSVERAFERFRKRPISLAIFPEGTRSVDGRLLPFRKGTMKICHQASLPVVPFSIDGACKVNPKDRFGLFPGPIRVRFGEAIPPEEVAAMSARELHDRVRGAVERMLGQVPTDSDERNALAAAR